jgi:hypothetical protein
MWVGPPDFGHLFDNLQTGYLMVRVFVVELSNRLLSLATFLTICKEVF